VRFVVVFKTKSLFSTPYTKSQMRLSDRVIRLRDRKRLTFPQIAAVLSRQGFKGARGASLDAKGVFSVYKKRMRRDARLNQTLTLTITHIEVITEAWSSFGYAKLTDR